MHVRNVLVRRLVSLEDLDDHVSTYERLLAQPARMRFDYPAKKLRLAQVGQILLIAGDAAALEPFRATAMTFLVQGISDYADMLPALGATIVHPVQRVPSGRNMLVRHPDGALVEYVEHDHPHPDDDVMTPA